MKRKLFLILLTGLLAACGQQKAESEPKKLSPVDQQLSGKIIGIWESSEKSFKDAETSPQYVEVKKDGSLRFFVLEKGEEKTKMPFKWKMEKGKLLIFNKEDDQTVIRAEIRFKDETHMIWINQDDKNLYLILGAG